MHGDKLLPAPIFYTKDAEPPKLDARTAEPPGGPL